MNNNAESVLARYERLFAAREQLRVDLQNKQDQLKFLKAVRSTETRSGGRYQGDSEYLRGVLGDASSVSEKGELIVKELARVENDVRACERDAKAAQIAVHAAETALATLQTVEMCIPHVNPVVDPSVTEVLVLERESAELRTTVADLERRIELYKVKLRQLRGERCIVDSAEIDRLLFGPFDADEKIRILTDVVVTKFQPALREAQTGLTQRIDRIRKLKVALARTIYPELRERMRRLFQLLDEAEKVSLELDMLVACRGVELPIGSDRQSWCGVTFFRHNGGRLDDNGGSPYRRERTGKVAVGLLPENEQQRRAS